MNNIILNGLKSAYSAYQASEYAVNLLKNEGFTEIFEGEQFNVQKGGKYYITRDNTGVIAFTVGVLSDYSYRIIASHIDSPALKLKYNPVMSSAGVKKLNVEVYGGAILSTFLDVPLKIAGRLVIKKGDEIYSKNYVDEHTYVIPNVAVHLNREINNGYAYNAQIDLSPILGIDVDGDYFDSLAGEGGKVIGYDLYVVNATEPFIAGADGSLICSAGLDDKVCAFGSVEALINSSFDGISVCYLADGEEIGSRVASGADSDFLKKTLKNINKALGYNRSDFDKAIARSFMVSADNAHAVHPNHPELSDPTNPVVLGGGVVIKHHANKNYTTDGLTAGFFEQLMERADIPFQHFFMRSDLKCGGTLGAISITQLAVKSVDVGAPQLAMHSSLETIAACDCDAMVNAFKAFYNGKFSIEKRGIKLN